MEMWIKNTDTVQHTWSGQGVDPDQYYMIEDIELHKWQANSQFLTDIANGIAVMSRSNSDVDNITDINEAINYLKGTGITETNVNHIPAFAGKTVEVNGVTKTLYKRVHGVNATIPANSTGFLEFTLPYTIAKFTGAELNGCNIQDTLDFFVLDDAANTQSGAPVETYGANILLNQFGFNVEMPDGPYKNTSNYDADIFAGMIISCAYKNNTASPKFVSMNIELHEVK